MKKIKIGEQIAFLRKQKGFTQEELAKALGVTNQAVSKWESDICCPDIQLLPTIAEMFDASVDELLGYKAPSTATDILLELRKKMDVLPEGEDFAFAFSAVAAIHAVLISKSMASMPGANPGWDADDVIEHAGKAEWGYSCLYAPQLTTTMKKGTILFSNNTGLDFNLTRKDIRRMASILKDFADDDMLKLASALHTLTVHDENAYTTAEGIVKKSGVAMQKVEDYLKGSLSSYVCENVDNPGHYRFRGMYMNLLPLISMLSI